MTRILALGTGPLLEGRVQSFNAHGLRTWHLVKPLLDAGHEVHLYTVPISTGQPETMEQAGCAARKLEDFSYQSFLNGDLGYIRRTLAEACETLKPDCLLGINSFPCYAIAQLPGTLPLWCDLNGAVVAEGELKERVYGNNLMLDYYWEVEQAALTRADRFSVVSQRQFYTLMGELGAVGRLNRHTATYDFAVHIPNAYHPYFAAAPPAAEPMRGTAFPEDAFAILWSGTYNAWTDVEMLFSAIEAAMTACPNMHYVSTGGAVFGHDDLTYARFERLVAGSAHKDRYHLLGWIEAERLPVLYRDADLGLCIDSRNHETLLGARNRTINMMAAGLPILTTRGAEISAEIVDANCALECDLDDAEDLAQTLCHVWREREKLKSLGTKGRHYILDRFDYRRTVAPLLAWVEKPAVAPDNAFKIGLAASGEDPFTIPTNPIEAHRLTDHVDKPPCKGVRGLARELGAALTRKAIGSYNYDRLLTLARTLTRNKMPMRGEGRAFQLDVHFDGCDSDVSHLAPAEYEQIAESLPPFRRLVLHNASRGPLEERRRIVHLLANHSSAARVSLIEEAEQPEKIQALCAWLREERKAPSELAAWIRLDGTRETHNRLHANPRGWLFAMDALQRLTLVKRQWPGQFDYGALTAVTSENWRELEELGAALAWLPYCRHRFEVATGSLGPPPEVWPQILAAVKRIQRRAGVVDPMQLRRLRLALKPDRTPTASCGRMATIRADGRVGLCPMRDPVGNLRDHGFNFTRLWKSPGVQAERARPLECSNPYCQLLAQDGSWRGRWGVFREL